MMCMYGLFNKKEMLICARMTHVMMPKIKFYIGNCTNLLKFNLAQ